jgi:hypothetical protein
VSALATGEFVPGGADHSSTDGAKSGDAASSNRSSRADDGGAQTNGNWAGQGQGGSSARPANPSTGAKPTANATRIPVAVERPENEGKGNTLYS